MQVMFLPSSLFDPDILYTVSMYTTEAISLDQKDIVFGKT
jgi:hypothetical protein